MYVRTYIYSVVARSTAFIHDLSSMFTLVTDLLTVLCTYILDQLTSINANSAVLRNSSGAKVRFPEIHQ